MNMKRRLAVRFSLQLAAAGLAALVVFLLCLNWMIGKFNDLSVSSDFATAGLEKLLERSTFEQGSIHFSTELLEQVKANDGWLQTLAADGSVEQSYNTPRDVPVSYAPGELVDYWNKRKPFAYDILLWIREINGTKHTIIYGYPNKMELALADAMQNGAWTEQHELMIPPSVQSYLFSSKSFIQLLDSNGNEVAALNKPEQVPSHYSFQELALRSRYNERYGYLYSSSYDPATSYTWIIAMPNYSGGTNGTPALLPGEIQVLLKGGLMMIGALIIIFLIMSLHSTRRFGMPMIHLLAWLNRLSFGQYGEPTDRLDQAKSKKKNGVWRTRYKVFSDVFLSVQQLEDTLKRDQNMRKQNNRLREEWIAGITHDLKTPLSSIKGYAHMLVEDKYCWSKEEVKQFSSIILDKSAHIHLLLNDLELIYRNKANITQPDGEVFYLHTHIEALLRQIAIQFPSRHIELKAALSPIAVKLYKPWLDRIINNIATNALLHNPSGTKLTVEINDDSKTKSLQLTFADNGTGMNEETANRLFERYYRGTSTSERIEGSGLGMAIAKELTEALGGSISVQTSIASGTVITIGLSDKVIVSNYSEETT